MNDHGLYYADLTVAWVVRLGLYLGTMAILAIVLSGCNRADPQNILPSMSSERLSLTGGDGDQTRNQQPQRGCDEKSDSSLKRPLS
jgi:hypothetical protein